MFLALNCWNRLNECDRQENGICKITSLLDWVEMNVCLGDTLTLMLPHVLEQVWKNTTISLDLHETNRFSAHISIHKKYFRNEHWNDVKKTCVRNREKKSYKNKTKQNKTSSDNCRARIVNKCDISKTPSHYNIQFLLLQMYFVYTRSHPEFDFVVCSLARSLSRSLSLPHSQIQFEV